MDERNTRIFNLYNILNFIVIIKATRLQGIRHRHEHISINQT